MSKLLPTPGTTIFIVYVPRLVNRTLAEAVLCGAASM
jgi:hypothetical protein